MSKFSNVTRGVNCAASLLIATGVCIDLYDRFKGKVSMKKAQVTTETANEASAAETPQKQ